MRRGHCPVLGLSIRKKVSYSPACSAGLCRRGQMILAIDPGISTGWCLLGKDCIACSAGENWPSVLEAIIEYPEVYPDTRPSQANNLITLALRVGQYKERLERVGVNVRLVKPKEWKGQTPKDVHHRRGRAKLSANEQTFVDAAVLR